MKFLCELIGNWLFTAPPAFFFYLVVLTTASSAPASSSMGIRPGFHYTRPQGWQNDPVPFFDADEERFHMFSVCDPNSTKAPWAGGWQGWCHASSPDMASQWTTHAVAIPAESPGTGSVVALPAGSKARAELGGARAAILTASAAPFAPQLWVASDPNLTQWRPLGKISLPNATANVTGVDSTADVHAWRDEQRSVWRLVTSGVSVGGAPPVLLQYENSGDSLLSGWSFVGVLYTGSKTNRLECPSYYAVPGQKGSAERAALLTYSWPARGYAQFWVGGTDSAAATADGRSTFKSFKPDRMGQLEFGIGYAAEMTASWPGRLLLFSWMRGVSDDGATYVGAQSLPREMSLLEDGTAMIHVAKEIETLVIASSTQTTNLTATPAEPARPFAASRAVDTAAASRTRTSMSGGGGGGGIPQQARLLMRVKGSGSSLPASFGISLQQGAAQLRLAVVVEQGGACMTLDPRQGCAPIAPPLGADGRRRGGVSGTPWTLATGADVWLDNGLVEIIAGNGSAVLSAFYPRLFSTSATMNGTVWAENNATAAFRLEWSTVRSATFIADD